MERMKWRGRATVSLFALLIACSAPTEDGPSPSSAQPSPGPIVVRTGRIVFSGDDGEIHLLSLSDGRDRTVTSFRGPQFDPDGHGRLLVFRDSRAGVNVNDDIAVIRADGTGFRNLTRTPDANEWGPVWSPDGRQIAYSSDENGVPQLFVMDADGSNVRHLSDTWGEYPAWSPDGSRIAFASSMGGSTPFGDPDYDVWVMGADGSDEINLTPAPESNEGYPTWSPDGAWIAFESTRGTPSSFEPPPHDLERQSDEDIWVMRPDGSGPRNLTSDLVRLDKFPDWSRRGLLIDREGSIVILDPRTGTQDDVSERTGVFGNFPAWVERG
jgi:Tol biopolymer transport system component